jgi:hypothetical protein
LSRGPSSARSCGVKKKRPGTASKATLPKVTENPLCCLVNQRDRLKSKDVIAYLKKLIETASIIQNPVDDIEKIFNKILAWKRRFGDLDAQEKAVSKALRNHKKNAVKIHNVKTLTEKLHEISDDIGLNNNELMIIIYTSLDHDYLTNMIV